MNVIAQIFYWIRSIFGLAGSVTSTANSIKRSKEQSRARKLKSDAEKAAQQPK